MLHGSLPEPGLMGPIANRCGETHGDSNSPTSATETSVTAARAVWDCADRVQFSGL